MNLEKCPKCDKEITTLSSTGRKFCSSCKWTEKKVDRVEFSQAQQHQDKNLKSSRINNNLERIIIVVITAIVTTTIIKSISPSSADISVAQNDQKEELKVQPQSKKTNTQPDSPQLETINSTQEQEQPNTKVSNSQLETESKKTVIEYLDDITQKGSSGYGYWCQSSQELLSSLYAARSYQILDEFESDSSASYTVRIESSTKGGFPVVSNWSIYMKEESNNWCIALLSER